MLNALRSSKHRDVDGEKKNEDAMRQCHCHVSEKKRNEPGWCKKVAALKNPPQKDLIQLKIVKFAHQNTGQSYPNGSIWIRTVHSPLSVKFKSKCRVFFIEFCNRLGSLQVAILDGGVLYWLAG